VRIKLRIFHFLQIQHIVVLLLPVACACLALTPRLQRPGYLRD